MRAGATLSLLLALLFLPGAAGAHEGAARSLLAAEVRSLPRSLKQSAPSWVETAPLVMRREKKHAPLVGTALWLPMQEARTALATPPWAQPRAADQFRFVSRKEKSSFSSPAPLPRKLLWITFTHSRVRGPFEQVYPRLW